jgi:hypothetical protein
MEKLRSAVLESITTSTRVILAVELVCIHLGWGLSDDLLKRRLLPASKDVSSLLRRVMPPIL